VVDLLDYPVDPDLPDWEERGASRLAAERAEVGSVLADWPGEWDYQVRRGDPARALAEIAAGRQARMIVVGTSHGSGLAVALERLAGTIRSVAHALERADIPVLVVPDHSRKHR
jgi:nucleotide-binding universal stress UspA family protein